MIMRISNEPLRIQSAVKEIYTDLVESKKLFTNNNHLFSVGLVYGLLHNKQHMERPTADFAYLRVIGDDVVKNVIDLVFCILDDGRDPKEIWQEMLHIADGGVLALNDIYKANNDFRIPHLVQESEQLWPERVKDLHNINR